MGCMCGGCTQCLADQGWLPEDFEISDYEEVHALDNLDNWDEFDDDEKYYTPNEKLSQEMMRKIRENK